LSAIGVIAPGRTFERAAEMGRRLADAVLAELPRIPAADVGLAAGSVVVELPLKSYPPAGELAREASIAEQHLASLAGRGPGDAELRQAMMNALYASIGRILAEANSRYPSGVMPLHLRGVRIGAMVLAGLPAEAFAEVGQHMKAASGSKILVVGLANGYVGYVPCRQAYPEGGYEIVSSRVTPEAEDALAGAAARLAFELLEER
jgi:hypothetical protein